MRKFTLIIASLLLTVGAMAQTVAYTVNAGTGTLYKNGTEAAASWNSKWAFTVTETNSAALTLTAEANNIGKYTENGVSYLGLAGGQSGTSVYTLAVPYGYLIDSYSFDFVAVSGAATVTPNGGSAMTASSTSQTLAVNNINFRFVTFTLSGGNHIIKAKNFVVNIKKAPLTYEEVGNPTEDGVYRVYWKQNDRGYLAYHYLYPTKGVLADVTLGNYGSSHFNSATDPVLLEWYLITSDGGNKYLFSAYNGKFLSYSEESADAAKAAYFDAARPLPITITDNTSHSGYYIIKANVDGTDKLLSSGCGTASRTGYPIRWNALTDMGDGGSPLTFVKVTGLDVDEAIIAKAQAAINDYENPVEANVNFEWTTSTPWTAVEHSAYYTSTVFNDNELDGVKYIEGEVTVDGARTATVTFTYIDGDHKLNIRGVEVIDAKGNIVAGDYHVGTAGGEPVNNTYTVSVAEAGTYKVRCYAAEGNGDSFSSSHGSIVISFAKLDVIDLTKEVTFSAEYSTLYLGYKVAIPAGVEAYVLSAVNASWATLTQINNVIPANTPVILKKTANANTYNFYYTSSDAEDVEINYLEGSIADRYVQGDAYVLGLVEGEVCLAPAKLNQVNNTSFKNNANKAYLKVAPGMNEVSFYGFRFEGEDEENTTGIEVVENVNENVIFDLSGRRVSEITEKGIYIIDGKKVLVK